MNQLNRPEVIATDHNGTVYIYDAGNKYIRVVDPVTKIMSTMIHGSCRRDFRTSHPVLRVPFALELKAMICFKSWIKTRGKPEEHLAELPTNVEILNAEAIIVDYEGFYHHDEGHADVFSFTGGLAHDEHGKKTSSTMEDGEVVGDEEVAEEEEEEDKGYS